MLTSSRILNYFNRLDINPRLAFSNSRANRGLTHAYHRYPAKFVPTLASYLINIYSKKNDTVCDPFGGCGTTLVEAMVNGRKSIGIDINPLASLISKVKITPIRPDLLKKEEVKLSNRIKITKLSHIKSSKRLHYWFDANTMVDLQKIYDSIEKTNNIEVKRFFKCAFSNILKNCSRWLMSSTKPTIDRNKVPANAFDAFNKQLLFMERKNMEFYNLIGSHNQQNRTKFYLRDARKTGLHDNSIDYILTSPPYVTSYEYADLHELGLLWFENIANWIDFKKKFVGTTFRKLSKVNIHSHIGNYIINELKNKDLSLSQSTAVYYEDMFHFLREFKRILKRGKKLTLVIGNTKLRGVDILNAEVSFEQLNYLGFKKIFAEKRQTSSQSITPYRDINTGRFSSITNPNKRRAYQYEYLVHAVNS